ncbi:MAG: hypothetical protein ACOH5I_13280 [Oligoflexus sp.]
MLQLRRFSLYLGLLVSFACGGGGGKKGATVPAPGPIETALLNASATHQIPYPLLLAVALKESGMSPEPSYTTYVNEELTVGLRVGETAFGLSMETLGLDPENGGRQLEVQIEAYAAWVAAQLTAKHLELAPHLNEPDLFYDWVWQLALLHRQGNDNRKNVQIIFARELMQIINDGANWQDSKSDEIIRLLPRAGSTNLTQFSPQIQRNLQLDTQRSEIFAVDYMQLTYEQISGPKNRPEFVRVLHCPFSLSACLEIQNRSDLEQGAHLQAHYIIPPDSSLLNNPIKIRQHRSPVLVTNNRGQAESVQNAVVVMLVGSSGRYVNGYRVQANPSWYTNEQLKNFSKILRGICELMRLDEPDFDLSRCQSPGGQGGVQFQHQGQSEQYHWGDIPDFDESIFWTYVNDSDELGGQIAIEFGPGERIFQAGQAIKFQLSFITGAAKIMIEYMERCSNQKLVWTTLETRFIRNTNTQPFQMTLYDQGPNANGQHFFRALVFDQSNTLKAWAVTDVLLRNYEEESQPAANLKACERLGT